MTKILMIVSAADSLTLADGTAHPAGYWAEEVAASHKVLREAGFSVDIATPGGVVPTVDAVSLDSRGGVAEQDAKEFRAYLDSIDADLAAPLSLADVKTADYDALYVPGGHAPMVDLVSDSEMARLLVEADGLGRTVAVLCHGVAALLSADRPDGSFLFAGRRLTAFTNEEEQQGGLGDATPWLVEDRLSEKGAVLETGAAWSSTVVVDGNLISGQNPQSSVATARQVVTALNAV